MNAQYWVQVFHWIDDLEEWRAANNRNRGLEDWLNEHTQDGGHLHSGIPGKGKLTVIMEWTATDEG